MNLRICSWTFLENFCTITHPCSIFEIPSRRSNSNVQVRLVQFSRESKIVKRQALVKHLNLGSLKRAGITSNGIHHVNGDRPMTPLCNVMPSVRIDTRLRPQSCTLRVFGFFDHPVLLYRHTQASPLSGLTARSISVRQIRSVNTQTEGMSGNLEHGYSGKKEKKAPAHPRPSAR